MTNVETAAPVVLSRSFDSKIRKWKYLLLALGLFALVLLGILGIPYALMWDTTPSVRGSTDLSELDLDVDVPGGLGENHMIWYGGTRVKWSQSRTRRSMTTTACLIW